MAATEKELYEFAGKRLAKFKLPRRFEFSADPLPKGGTGKILKRQLREKYWQHEERRVRG
jgi:acyl-CoA synthetase (AMP-forming)/AMP-acid ligase II